MGDGGTRIGLIAGGGALPAVIAEHLTGQGRPPFVVRLAPYADEGLRPYPGEDFNLGQIGQQFEHLKAEGCNAVCFAGVVRRVDPTQLNLDPLASSLLPRVLAAMKNGDDALMRVFVEAAEEAGFRVLGAEEACPDILAGAGVLGAASPDQRARADIAKAAAVAQAVGAWDIGQGVVVCEGLVLAVEAQEGTDLMLRRVGQLPEAVRGTAAARRGVLVKRPKPRQERRIDLPTIGLATVATAAAAGLAGIAVEAGGALFLQREEALARADQLGLFVYGFSPADPAA
jgi:hypothetical protein